MLNLRRLDILQRFARHGSIAAAALDLGYSASAVSQQLARLEREAGVALIERTSHTASLTDAGHELVEHASAILAAVETAQSRMRARAGTIAGRVRISCIPGLAATVAPHLAALQRRHPDLTVVTLHIESARAEAALLERTTDVAVIDDWGEESVATASALRIHRVHREPIVLAVPGDHPIAADPKPISATTLHELAQSETWLSTPVGQVSRIAGDARLAKIGAEPSRRWEFDGLYVLARLVAVGAGIALLPASIAAYEQSVVALPLRPRMVRSVHVLTRSTLQQDPAIASCLDAVRQALRPQPAATAPGGRSQ
jgi:molybdate transport repressor ModE-like protein